jgi:superoxide dismutase, Cu-Zn family
MRSFLLVVAFLTLSGGAVVGQESPKHETYKPITVEFINAEGQSVGAATLSETSRGVKIVLNMRNLPPGQHLMHIHEFPKCEVPDFKSAGPHFNPPGDRLPKGITAGDIPNFVLSVGADGTARTTTIAPYVTLGDDTYSLFRNGGTSLIIHAVAEQVSASAPPRIACAVVAKPQ